MAAVPVAFPDPAPPASVPAIAEPRRQVKGWRSCQRHPRVRSESVCPKCWAGHCNECTEKVQNAVICPDCQGLCVPAAAYEAEEERQRQRARPMMQELGTILAYPMGDPIAYVLLALFTWFFGALGRFTAAYGFMLRLLLSQGVLMWYCFYALSRVSNGRLKGYMPDFSDISDLIRPLRLSAAALLISWAPILLLAILVPGLALAGFFSGGASPSADNPALSETASMPDLQEPVAVPAGDQEIVEAPATRGAWAERFGLAQAAVWIIVVVVGALVWKIVYTPVALTVAGLSSSVLSTLNPVIGFDTIRRMGTVYWQAMGIYTLLSLVQWLLGAVFALIPFLGGLLKSFVDAYAYLAIACTLGLAVFKRGRELGFD
jgi:hypothetical protein